MYSMFFRIFFLLCVFSCSSISSTCITKDRSRKFSFFEENCREEPVTSFSSSSSAFPSGTSSKPDEEHVHKRRAVDVDVEVSHFLTDGDSYFLTNISSGTPKTTFIERDPSAPNSIKTFFSSLPIFSVCQAPSELPILDEIEDSVLFKIHTKYVTPTFGTLTVSQDFFEALNILPSLTITDEAGWNIHFLKDIITLQHPNHKKDILHLVPNSVLFTPISFRALRVVPLNICPKNSIILPTKGFEYLLGTNVSLSMTNSEEEFRLLISKIPDDLLKSSFYNGNNGTLSKIVEKYIPLIECFSISADVWQVEFKKLYSLSQRYGKLKKPILRWIIDRIFGDLLKKLTPPLNHPFLLENRYTALDLFDVFSISGNPLTVAPIALAAQKMIGRNHQLINDSFADQSITKIMTTNIANWTFEQQILLATTFQPQICNNVDFMLKWIDRIIVQIKFYFDSNNLYKDEQIEKGYDLLELVFEMLNKENSSTFHSNMLSLMISNISIPQSKVARIMFKVFKEKGIFLYPKSMKMNTYLMKMYYFGHKSVCVSFFKESSTYHFDVLEPIKNEILKIVPLYKGKLHLLKSSLYQVVEALNIKDPVASYNSDFYVEFSKSYCILFSSYYDEYQSNKSTRPLIQSSDFDVDRLLSNQTEDGNVVISDRFIHSIAKQSWARSREGIISFGILFETAKQLCLSNLEIWKLFLEMLIEQINSLEPTKTNLICLSIIMRECLQCNIECVIPSLQNLYTYRYMKAILDGNTFYSKTMTLRFVESEKTVKLDVNLITWASTPCKCGICCSYDFDRYSREYANFFASVGHLLFGVPPSFLRINSTEASTLSELSTFMEYALIRYAEFLNGKRKSTDQKFRILFFDSSIDEYELLLKKHGN